MDSTAEQTRIGSYQDKHLQQVRPSILADEKNIYTTQGISIRAKFRHFNTVVKPEGSYAW